MGNYGTQWVCMDAEMLRDGGCYWEIPEVRVLMQHKWVT